MNAYQTLLAIARRGKLPAHWVSAGTTMQVRGDVWSGADTGSWILATVHRKALYPLQSDRLFNVPTAVRVPAHVAMITGLGRASYDSNIGGRIDQ